MEKKEEWQDKPVEGNKIVDTEGKTEKRRRPRVRIKHHSFNVEGEGFHSYESATNFSSRDRKPVRSDSFSGGSDRKSTYHDYSSDRRSGNTENSDSSSRSFSRGESYNRNESRAPRDNRGGYGERRESYSRYNRNDSSANTTEGGYKPRTEGGYRGRTEGGYKPRTEGGYRGRTEGGYKPREGGGYRGRSEGGYKPREEGGYRGRTEGGYKPREEGGYRGRSEGGYKPREEGGYRGRSEGGYKPRTEGGYRGRSEGGYKPRTEGGYRGRSEGGYSKSNRRISEFVPEPRPEYKIDIDPTDHIRLNKFLANAGVCSRREADELIKNGLVKVNDIVVKEMGIKVSATDTIIYKDQEVSIEKKVYVLLNKPKDCITTSDDPQERRTVKDLVRSACKERIYPVGRLDRNTTGVLLLTNDGDLASKLTHPKYEKRKIYQVTLDKDVIKADLEKILAGIELEDGIIVADNVSYVDDEHRNVLGIEIHSGRNRIVRRIFEYLGYKVYKLDRVYFAGLTKKNLPRGKWRYLSEKEVSLLKMGAFI